MRSQLLLVPSAAVADDRLLPVDVYILLVLGDFCDAGGWTRVSQRTLAETARQSRQTVISSLQRLEAAGWLQSRSDGPGGLKEYRRVLDNVPPSKGGVEIVDIPVEILDTPLPDGFPDAEAKARASTAFPHIDVEAAAAAFRARHTAQASFRRDWRAAWVRWCQTAHRDKEPPDGHAAGRGNGAAARDPRAEIARLAAGAARHAARSAQG